MTLTSYIFPLPRNAFPREGTGVKTDFFFREKVSLSAVVGKKDGCLTDQSPSVARVDSAGKLDSPSDRRPRKGKLSQGKENGLIVRFPSRGNAFLAGGCIFFLERASLNVS